MSARDDLRRAVHANDTGSIDRLGWTPFFDVLDKGWAKKLDTTDRLLYATVLGDREPQVVLDALLNIARAGDSAWRPKPSQVAAALPKAGNRTNTTPVAPRPDRRPDALAHVSELVAADEPICSCVGARSYSRNDIGVLRCVTCFGLEQGQVDTATEDQA